MGMASNTDDMERVRADFRAIADVFRAIRDDEALSRCAVSTRFRWA